MKTPEIPHHFESDAVLTELLAGAGCELSVEDVRFEFSASLEEDEDTRPWEIIPLLFELEPRFESPAEARRLYANLLGLWDRVAIEARGGALPVIQADAAPAQPPEGGGEGPEGLAPYVAFEAWRLAEDADKARARAEDRLENRQADLCAWVREALAECAPQTEEVVLGLCVHAHEVLLHGLGEERVSGLTFSALSQDPSPQASDLEALAVYQDEVLDEALTFPEDPVPPEDRAPAAAALRRVRLAFSAATAPQA